MLFWASNLIEWWYLSLFLDALFIRYLYLQVIKFMILISANHVESCFVHISKQWPTP